MPSVALCTKMISRQSSVLIKGAMAVEMLENGPSGFCQITFSYPQHAAGFVPQHAGSGPPHVGSFSPRSAALIIAAAQPTPLSTLSAPVGQLSWHAPHSMQASALTICTRRVSCVPGAKTPCGHTVLHIPQLMHAIASNSNVLRWLSATNPICISLAQPQVLVSIGFTIVYLITLPPRRFWLF